jgi:hypothetical protein
MHMFMTMKKSEKTIAALTHLKRIQSTYRFGTCLHTRIKGLYAGLFSCWTESNN